MKILLTEIDELREENRRLRNDKGDLEEKLNAVLKENKKLKAERDVARETYEEQETLWPGR